MCKHQQVIYINPYELIRKYKCDTCGEVMMCACEKEFGTRFLPHQLHEASEYGTRKSIPVTLGFQKDICNTCRGLPEEAYPKAEIYGMSSKIRRYYWREIYFETTKRFADWAVENGYSDTNIARQEKPDIYASIEKEVIQELQALHKRAPKYVYQEESQSDVLAKNKVEIIDVDGTYIKAKGRKSAILQEGKVFTAEEFAINYYTQKGYKTLVTESIPFHALFGVFMWILIQDPSDPQVRIMGFGERSAYEDGRKGEQIWTHLPDDFGTPGYANRRATAINEHLASIPKERKELLWLFNYWVEHSEELRQYLWAHRKQDIEKARELLNILPVEVIHRILKYLVEDYWGRFTGWPDLLVHNWRIS